MSEAPQFFYNIRTGQVEELAHKGQSKELMGPYPTRETAEHALGAAQARTHAWDEQDRAWEEGRRGDR
jgi:hypothetical protein